jgi:cytochrome c
MIADRVPRSPARRLIPHRQEHTVMKATAWAFLATIAPLPALAAAGDDFDRGLALAQQKDCLECHALNRADVGPAFAAIAARYRNDPQAPERLAYAIRGGSAGHWGDRFAMWPQRQLSDQELRLLVRWILAQ